MMELDMLRYQVWLIFLLSEVKKELLTGSVLFRQYVSFWNSYVSYNAYMVREVNCKDKLVLDNPKF